MWWRVGARCVFGLVWTFWGTKVMTTQPNESLQYPDTSWVAEAGVYPASLGVSFGYKPEMSTGTLTGFS